MSAVVLFRGRVVGEGPVLKFSRSGTAWVSMSVATKPMRRLEDGSREKPKNPVFLEVRAFGDRAEAIAQTVSKGDFIEGSGTWEQRRWEGEDGARHQRDYVVTNSLPLVRPAFESSGAAAPVDGDEEDAWGSAVEPPFEEEG